MPITAMLTFWLLPGQSTNDPSLVDASGSSSSSSSVPIIPIAAGAAGGGLLLMLILFFLLRRQRSKRMRIGGNENGQSYNPHVTLSSRTGEF